MPGADRGKAAVAARSPLEGGPAWQRGRQERRAGLRLGGGPFRGLPKPAQGRTQTRGGALPHMDAAGGPAAPFWGGCRSRREAAGPGARGAAPLQPGRPQRGRVGLGAGLAPRRPSGRGHCSPARPLAAAPGAGRGRQMLGGGGGGWRARSAEVGGPGAAPQWRGHAQRAARPCPGPAAPGTGELGGCGSRGRVGCSARPPGRRAGGVAPSPPGRAAGGVAPRPEVPRRGSDGWELPGHHVTAAQLAALPGGGGIGRSRGGEGLECWSC